MNYFGSANEKAVRAGDLNRTHVGLTVSFQGNETTTVFGRIAGIGRTDNSVHIALDGVTGSPSLQSSYPLGHEQNVFVQPDMLSSTESAIKDIAAKVQESFKGSKTDDK